MSKTYKKYSEFDTAEREMYDELYLMASNNGDFYPHNPEGSISYSFQQYTEQKLREIQVMFEDIQQQLTEELQEDWS